MNILRVNMASGECTLQDMYGDFWGRGLIAEVLNREVPPHCHPLGRSNKLIIAVGPLAGTSFSSTSRVSVGGKSPLTQGAKEANSGGTAGAALARWGMKAIIVEGLPASEGPYVLRIGKDNVAEKRSDLKNTGTYDLCARLLAEYGDKVSIICIGPAGEFKLTGAGVAMTDMEGLPGRYAARGGLGALMGSKGLKAIVIEHRKGSACPVHNREEMLKVRKKWNDAVLNAPGSKMMAQLGTLAMFSVIQMLGGVPVRNYRYGQVEDGEALVSSAALRRLIEKRGGVGTMTHACMTGCLVRCSNVVPDEKGEYLVSPLEYETMGMMGSNLGITSLHDIGRLNYLCNDIGLDTIETGGALGVAMDAGLLPFGDVQGAADLLEQVRSGETLGRVIGCGVETTSKVFGMFRAPQVKGQGLPAYDPRAVKGLGVTYATSPMGGDHTAGITVFAPVDHHSAEGQVEVSKQQQIITAAIDTAGLCSFICAAIMPQISLLTEAWNAIHGTQLQVEDFFRTGRQTISRELEFNAAAGIPPQANCLPEFMELEGLGQLNLTFDVNKEALTNIFTVL